MPLFICAESDQRDIGLFPADNTLCAVVGAEVGGTGTNRWLVIRQPVDLQLPNGSSTSPMFDQGDPTKPLWLRVDRAYAGEPRTISSSLYEKIWIDWFFYPSGNRYEPLQQVRMPISGERFAMEQVRMVYLMLRRLQHRVPEDFAHLGQVALDPALSVRPPGRTLCGAARRGLELDADEELGDRGRVLLAELLVFNPTLQCVELVKPWRRNPL